MRFDLANPAGTQFTQKAQLPNAGPQHFGSLEGKATASFGREISKAGTWLFDRGIADMKEEHGRLQTSNVMEQYRQGTSELRTTLYDSKNGLYTRTGANADEVFEEAETAADTLKKRLSANLKSDKERQAFERMWDRKSESVKDQAAKHEFTQGKALAAERKMSGLANLQAEAVANYQDADALKHTLDTVRLTIRANPDGISAEGVKRMESEAISSLHVAVIQRLAQDDPGAATDYYLKSKKEVSGADHAAAQQFIRGVARARRARSAVDEIRNGGVAGNIYAAVQGVESANDPDAVSPKGALGLMQLMPDTARETALAIGMPSVAGMKDKELKTFFATPEGQMANKRIGRTYLNQQIKRFNGDLEAALIAYNAGPGNAQKWLDADRDYDALPKKSETLPYVQKVLKAYTGVDVRVGGSQGSKSIQSALRMGKPKFTGGDARAFLKEKLHSDKNVSHIDNLAPVMADRLAALMEQAPDFVKAGLGVLSGARTVEHQRRLWKAAVTKYGSEEKARKWVAPPGSSQHNHGHATDLGWNGGKFSAAPAEVREWVHKNAENFGLRFPLGHEPWHIETAEARGGRPALGVEASRPRTGGRPALDVSGASTGNGIAGLPVTYTPGEAEPGEIYADILKPFTVPQEADNLTALLREAREQYADDPSLLAEVERQLTDDFKLRALDTKEKDKQLLQAAFQEIVNGKQVSDLDPSVLQNLPPKGVSTLLTLESKLKRDEDKTDAATYVSLTSGMGVEEFKKVNLLDFADKLSLSDLKSLADRQAKLNRDSPSATRSTDQTRTQIIGSAQNILGLSPNKNPEDAETMATINRLVNNEIDAYISANNKEPDGTVIQGMVDRLMLEGEVEGTLYNSNARLYELTPETAAKFVVEGRTADTFAEIPQQAHAEVAKTYSSIFKVEPNEDEALDLYNDIVRISLGATPEPPKVLKNRIQQGLAKRLGRAPTEEEIANTYRAAVVRASGAK